jgi:hypothetical protein
MVQTASDRYSITMKQGHFDLAWRRLQLFVEIGACGDTLHRRRGSHAVRYGYRCEAGLESRINGC